MYTGALWSVGVRHLVKLAAAHQPAMGKRQDLQNEFRFGNRSSTINFDSGC